MSFTNGWVTFENTLALKMFEWYKWYISDREGKEEPELDNWSKNAIRKMVDIEYAFRAYKKATIQQREWRMLSLWDVTVQQLNSGYAAHGDAETGGDYGVIGYWTWESRDDEVSVWQAEYDWRPNSVIKYMPDECITLNQETGECTEYGPATEVWDVNLLAGQPPRVLPDEPIIVDDVAQNVKTSLENEGWEVTLDLNNPQGKRATIIYNGKSYTRLLRYLFQCDYSKLPGPLADDLMDAMKAQGLCQ